MLCPFFFAGGIPFSPTHEKKNKLFTTNDAN